MRRMTLESLISRPLPTMRGWWLIPPERDRQPQTEYVPVPFADDSTFLLRAAVSDDDLLIPADILSTASEVGVLNRPTGPGDVVDGADPLGRSAVTRNST